MWTGFWWALNRNSNGIWRGSVENRIGNLGRTCLNGDNVENKSRGAHWESWTWHVSSGVWSWVSRNLEFFFRSVQRQRVWRSFVCLFAAEWKKGDKEINKVEPQESLKKITKKVQELPRPTIQTQTTPRMPHHTCGCVVNSPHNRTWGKRAVNNRTWGKRAVKIPTCGRDFCFY